MAKWEPSTADNARLKRASERWQAALSSGKYDMFEELAKAQSYQKDLASKEGFERLIRYFESL